MKYFSLSQNKTLNLAKTFVSIVLSATLVSGISLAQSEEPPAMTIEELIALIQTGRVEVNKESEKRERDFKSNLNQRQRMLANLRNELKNEKNKSVQLTKRSEELNSEIQSLRDRKKELQGSLDEVFGNLQGAASETSEAFKRSIITGQVGSDRIEFLKFLSESLQNEDSLPEIEMFERFWLELTKELYEQGRVVNYLAKYTAENGEIQDCEVARIGAFNVVCNGKYIVLSEYDSGKYSQLARQPGEGIGFGNKYLTPAKEFSLNMNSPQTVGTEIKPLGIAIDPTGPSGSSLLRSLVDVPTISDRIEQGRLVGYAIIVVGIFGVLLAIFKMLALTIVQAKVSRQAKTTEISTNNPLGRVLKVAEDEVSNDLELLETKLSEAIVKERPSIESFINALKIIASVAPLMGLLGTVTGMIVTFQQITLFGTGDPKTMAGGISQALVTTVLGLCVAIPTLLLHALVHSRAKAILHIIEERSIGLIAKRAEEAANDPTAPSKKESKQSSKGHQEQASDDEDDFDFNIGS